MPDFVKIPDSVSALRRLGLGEAVMRGRVDAGPHTALLRRSREDAAKAVKDCYLELRLYAVDLQDLPGGVLNEEAGTQEVYVTAWMIDGQGKVDTFTSDRIEGFRKGEVIKFNGNKGSTLVALRNPKQYVRWAFLVMEDDKKARDSANAVKQALKSNQVTAALGQIASAGGASEKVETAVELAASAIAGFVTDMLARNQDDKLGYVFDGGAETDLFGADDPNVHQKARIGFVYARWGLHLRK